MEDVVTTRPLYAIAYEIEANWKGLATTAQRQQYDRDYTFPKGVSVTAMNARMNIDALKTLESIRDNFYADSAVSVLSYLLGDLSAFTKRNSVDPEAPARIKAEIKHLLKWTDN